MLLMSWRRHRIRAARHIDTGASLGLPLISPCNARPMRLRRACCLEKFPLCRSIKHDRIPRMACHGSADGLRNQGGVGGFPESAQDFILSALPT
jgi:hypothetical protein